MARREIIDRNRIARNIRQLRMNFGETQEELGEAIGMNKSAVSNYELGNRRDLETLERIAEHYWISLDTLVRGEVRPFGFRNAAWADVKRIAGRIFARPVSPEDREDAAYMEVHETYRKILDGRELLGDHMEILDQLNDLHEGGHAEAGISLLILVSLEILTISAAIRNMEYYDMVFPEGEPAGLRESGTKEMVKTCFLRHFMDDIASDDPDYEREIRAEKEAWAKSLGELREDLAEFSGEVRGYDPEWMAFYDAWAQLVNLTGGEKEAAENGTLGFGRMTELARSGNPYAGRYVSIVRAL